MKNINFIAFGTFGSPNGFTQTFFLGNPIKGIKVFDIRGGLKIFPNSKVYSIRKESIDGFNILSYSIYTFAQEPTSSRGGSFIGSSILYVDKIAKELITIAQLNDFHNQLVSKNVSNDTISVNHSYNFSVDKPKDFDKIEFHLREIENLNFRLYTDKYLVVFCEINENNLNNFFEKSIDLLNVYDTIYFTDSQEVAEFVHQKGIFKLIQNVGEKRDFDTEIYNLMEERKRKKEQSISEFEKEISRLENDKNEKLKDYKEQIEKNRQIHKENEDNIRKSIVDLEQIKLIYSDFSTKIKDYVNQLRSGKKLDDVKKLYDENKRIFIESIQQLKRPSFINTISNPKVHTKPKNNPQHSQHSNLDNSINNQEIDNQKLDLSKIDIYKVLTFLLLILWIGTLGCLLYYINDKQHNKQDTPSDQKQNKDSIESETILYELNPNPQSELNKNDYKIIAENLTHNTKIEDVVKLIFDKNPSQIKNIYSGQEDIYGKLLIEKNKDCFKNEYGTFIFVNDTLRHIPSK